MTDAKPNPIWRDGKPWCSLNDCAFYRDGDCHKSTMICMQAEDMCTPAIAARLEKLDFVFMQWLIGAVQRAPREKEIMLSFTDESEDIIKDQLAIISEMTGRNND